MDESWTITLYNTRLPARTITSDDGDSLRIFSGSLWAIVGTCVSEMTRTFKLATFLGANSIAGSYHNHLSAVLNGGSGVLREC